MNSLDKSKKEIVLPWLQKAKTYLNARFRLHCEDDSLCLTHCLSHALSHPTDPALVSKCTQQHTEVCSECLNITTSIDFIEKEVELLPDTHAKAVLIEDTKTAKAKILEWQRHILRAVKQDKARDAAFKDLTSTEALWIRDFAQKINPSKVLHILI